MGNKSTVWRLSNIGVRFLTSRFSAKVEKQNLECKLHFFVYVNKAIANVINSAGVINSLMIVHTRLAIAGGLLQTWPAPICIVVSVCVRVLFICETAQRIRLSMNASAYFRSISSVMNVRQRVEVINKFLFTRVWRSGVKTSRRRQFFKKAFASLCVLRRGRHHRHNVDVRDITEINWRVLRTLITRLIFFQNESQRDLKMSATISKFPRSE